MFYLLGYFVVFLTPAVGAVLVVLAVHAVRVDVPLGGDAAAGAVVGAGDVLLGARLPQRGSHLHRHGRRLQISHLHHLHVDNIRRLQNNPAVRHQKHHNLISSKKIKLN